MARYSEQFGNNIIQKMVGPERQSGPDLSREYGVSGVRGRMIHPGVKQQVVEDIEKAVENGAPVSKCCDVLVMKLRTFYRWRKSTEDKRKGVSKTNSRALRESEKDAIVEFAVRSGLLIPPSTR